MPGTFGSQREILAGPWPRSCVAMEGHSNAPDASPYGLMRQRSGWALAPLGS